MEPTELTLQLLRDMTNDFSQQRIIGQGGFGTVYRGEAKNGQEVAVKLLHKNVAPELGDRDFKNELSNLKKLNHPHIVKLIGYCYEIEETSAEYNGEPVVAEDIYRALCLEFMHNGTPQNFLSAGICGSPLDWHTRFKIIKGAFEGLKYLHCEFQEPIYHLDLKPENILLDINMVPKLADFGLSKIFREEKTKITKNLKGTCGYMPPEYATKGVISRMFDIFSMGAVMLQTISGLDGCMKSDEMPAQEFIKQVHDSWRVKLQERWSGSSLEGYCRQVKRCTEIALQCIKDDRHQRPKITDIVRQLRDLESAADERIADRSIEPAAEWTPSDPQLANSTMGPAVSPPAIRTMEYAHTNKVFGSFSEASIPIRDDGGQQYEYDVATQHDPLVTARQESVNLETLDLQQLAGVFRRVAEECNTDVRTSIMKDKMHRYSASIKAFRNSKTYAIPKVVAMGPYYHGLQHLKQAESIKYVAAYQCLRGTNITVKVQDMYDKVVPEAYSASSLYEKDVLAGIGCDGFLHMMFFDACFLVQCMLFMSDYEGSVRAIMQDSLLSFFSSMGNEIFHDIMLLENQIPWPVVQIVSGLLEDFKTTFTVDSNEDLPMKNFIYSLKECLQDRKTSKDPEKVKKICLNPSYKPPHFLGLLRHCLVGRNKTKTDPLKVTDNISLSVSANELAEIGIEIKANEDTELIRMGIETKFMMGGKLFLAPLSLDDARATSLLSMAALELCTTADFQGAKVQDEDSAVCSYLNLLAMLVAREEDVQKLRTQHVLRGGGLANSEVLEFFTRLRNLRLGSAYVRTMQVLERYRDKRRTRIEWYGFWYRNKKTFIGGVITIIVMIIGIVTKSGSN